jgi:hemolysin III
LSFRKNRQQKSGSAAKLASTAKPTRREAALKRLQNINEYTLGEEVANSVTHGIGALLSIVALVLLILAALNGDGSAFLAASGTAASSAASATSAAAASAIADAAAAASAAADAAASAASSSASSDVAAASAPSTALRLTAAIIFGAMLILEYTNSTLYHAFPWPRVKRLFKLLDHSSIYLLIAGTYTPFTLLVLPPQDGIWMTAVIWGLAVAGVATEAFWLFRPRWLTAVVYLCMGWLIILRVNVLLAVMPTTGLALLIAGGICYSLGIMFYVMKHIRYMHSIWHLWTLAGSTLHFLSVLLYVL